MADDCDCRYSDEDGNPEPRYSPHREEPDCGLCNDNGCLSCDPHAPECECQMCTAPVREPITSITYTDEAPF